MLGRREIVAAVSAAVMAALAVVVAGVDTREVVEVRVSGRAAPAPEVVSAVPTTGPGTVRGPAKGGEASGRRVVWADDADVWLYDAGTGERRKLTTDGAEQVESTPRFRGSDRVTYLVSTAPYGQGTDLMEVDPTGGERRVLRRLPVGGTYGWSPDGETLAVYGGTSDGQAGELHIIGNGPRRVRRFPPILGRGGFVNCDETRIEWSPDGRHILLLDTALDTQQDETLFVLTPDGRDALPPRPGTWARWSNDGREVYCLCGNSGDDRDWTWQSVEVSSGKTAALPIPAAARPSLSPDGRFLAFDDGEDTPGVHVLDLDDLSGRPRLLASAALAPLWLSPDRIAVTDTRPCARTEDECIAGGHGSMFESAGTASAIDLVTGRRTVLPPIVTEGADTAPAGNPAAAGAD